MTILRGLSPLFFRPEKGLDASTPTIRISLPSLGETKLSTQVLQNVYKCPKGGKIVTLSFLHSAKQNSLHICYIGGPLYSAPLHVSTSFHYKLWRTTKYYYHVPGDPICGDTHFPPNPIWCLSDAEYVYLGVCHDSRHKWHTCSCHQLICRLDTSICDRLFQAVFLLLSW